MNYNFNKLFDNRDEYGCLGIILIVIIAIAIVFGVSCLYAWVALLLWNWVIVGVLGWVPAGVMTFWPMWGLVELCSILFKSRNFNSNSNNK